MDYTKRIEGFQIRDITYLPGYEPKEPERRFDIVKWNGESETEYCYSVATLEWNNKTRDFEFKSIGMRWLKEYPSSYVYNLILNFAAFKRAEYLGEENE